MAAMLDDMHYSNEQEIQHAFEGFPKNETDYTDILWGPTQADAYAAVADGAAGIGLRKHCGRMISDLLPQTAVGTGRTSCDQFFGAFDIVYPTADQAAARAVATDGAFLNVAYGREVQVRNGAA